MFRQCLVFVIFPLLAACSSKIYDDSVAGTFEGSLLVMWVEGKADGDGDGEFVYVPDITAKGNALVFNRAPQVDGRVVHATSISPDWMYTDGGSIPRIFQPVKGLNPWGYAPAYMVHDWLFVAHRCVTDGDASPKEREMAEVTFRESYEVMAEMLKTLEESGRISESDVQPRAISWAVSTGISENLWKKEGVCLNRRVKNEHRDQILARLRIGAAGTQKSVRINGRNVKPATVLQVVKF